MLFQRKQTLRQYAACLKFHDIVVIIDEHKATTVTHTILV